ncbi:MAG TPA: pantoate--beta-alanine ligase, partial [Longimicrobiales bacterium]|nr:pantoate--beta-alanine ligase [Longimicrobiales bacterium]
LELGVEVETARIVREPDGLAMSSRNAYLSPEERAQAVGLHHALTAASRLWGGEGTHAERLIEEVRRVIGQYPLLELQYAQAVHPATLEPVATAGPGTILALAAFCGTTRLIDNMELA